MRQVQDWLEEIFGFVYDSCDGKEAMSVCRYTGEPGCNIFRCQKIHVVRKALEEAERLTFQTRCLVWRGYQDPKHYEKVGKLEELNDVHPS